MKYGTRSQTVLAVWRDGRVEQRERYIEKVRGAQQAGRRLDHLQWQHQPEIKIIARLGTQQGAQWAQHCCMLMAGPFQAVQHVAPCALLPLLLTQLRHAAPWCMLPLSSTAYRALLHAAAVDAAAAASAVDCVVCR